MCASLSCVPFDADGPEVSHIGRIAATGVPDRQALIRDLLDASPSLLAIFPPARITVTAEGRTYDKLCRRRCVRPECLDL